MDEPVLDQYGEWQDDPTYGRVWMPGYAYGGYDPFGYGSWQRVGFGWGWVDPYPWSPYTFYGGRWVHVHNRWCWTPPRHDPLPTHWRETHPFGRPRSGKGTVMPVDRELPNATARAPSASEPNEPSRVTPRETAPQAPRVTPSKPRSGTFIPIQPRTPSQPQPMTAPSSSHTMRPSTSSGNSSSSNSSSSSSSPSRPSTMSSRPSRESGATSEP
jgi:hypothetical protein